MRTAEAQVVQAAGLDQHGIAPPLAAQAAHSSDHTQAPDAIMDVLNTHA